MEHKPNELFIRKPNNSQFSILNSQFIKLLFILIFFSAGVSARDFTQYVKTDIGTAHCRWFHYAPASVPFGMAKAGPSTDGHLGNPSGWEAVGYDCRHTSIEGFPNFHEFQIGGIVFAPITGKLQTLPGALETPSSGYRSMFDKKDEISVPGYYSVLLKDYGIKAELTATERVAFHQYTFPASKDAHILFDIGRMSGESGPAVDALVEYDGKDRIEGYLITSPRYVQTYQEGADVRMYFSAVIDKTPVKWGSFTGETVHEGRSKESGLGAGLYLTFKTKAKEKVLIKVGLSYTSIENARNNLEKEAKKMNFEEARKLAHEKWNEGLGRIAIEGGKKEDRVKFYTGLYHAILGRGLASDINGAYPRNDGSMGQIPLGKDGKPIHQHYNTDAIWGAFWNLTQLWTLAYPEYFSNWIQSQLLVYKDAGWLGDGIACSKYVSGVGTNFIGLTIASAYNCGIRDFDMETGYKAAIKNELEWRNRIEGAGKMDTKAFVERGYSPIEDKFKMGTTDEGSGFGASHTLEYSFSAYAVANLAKKLGKLADYETLNKLAGGWKLLYNDSLKLIHPKHTDGTFIANFNPHEPWRGFQEGNAIQYTFYVPHHIEQLVDTMGRDTFNARLDSIFQLSQKDIFGGGATLNAFSGLQTVYNHGNQPCLHISWLFNFSGRPDLSQKWVRAICDDFYGTDAIHGYGYGQDEDQGQLGAWYVMSAMGLFDVKGLTAEIPSFQIGSPLFDKITIQLNPQYYKGKEFVINVTKESPAAIYVEKISYNNKKLPNNSITFEELTKGGVLDIYLNK